MNLRGNIFLKLRQNKNIFNSSSNLLPKTEQKFTKSNFNKLRLKKENKLRTLSSSKYNVLNTSKNDVNNSNNNSTSENCSTKNCKKILNFLPFSNKKEDKNSNSPLIDHIKKYNSRNIKLNKSIENVRNEIKFFGDAYKKIMSFDEHKYNRRKVIGSIEKKYCRKGYKLSEFLLKNNIFSKSPLLMNNQKQMVDYYKLKNIQEMNGKKFPKNNSEKFLTNSYQIILNNLNETIIGDIEKEEFLKQQKIREEEFYKKFGYPQLENEINENIKEIENTKEAITNLNLEKFKYNMFIVKERKSSFLQINNNRRKKLSFDSKFDKDNIIPEIFSINNEQINKDNMKEQLIFPSESNEKASLLKYDEHFERRKNKSMTLIHNSGFKIQRIRPSSPRIKRRHQSHKILIKHEEEKEQKNIEETYHYLKKINENIKDFGNDPQSKQFNDIFKRVMKKNLNNKEIKLDKISIYKGFKNLRLKIEGNKIQPKLKKYSNIKLSNYFKEKLEEEVELDYKMQNFEKILFELFTKNHLE